MVQSNLAIRNVLLRNLLVLRNHFLWPICHLLHMNKEHLALRNNFRVTKKFLIAKFDCTFRVNFLFQKPIDFFIIFFCTRITIYETIFWLRKINWIFKALFTKSCLILDSDARTQYVNLVNSGFSMKPIHCFDKVNLILDPPGLSKKNKMIL